MNSKNVGQLYQNSIKMNIVNGEIEINAAADKVWDALTNSNKVIQYTGSQLETTWKVNDNVTWSGEMQGMPYINKGKVLVFNPHELLSFSYWSGIGGDEDRPENYSTIIYEIIPVGDNTCILTYHRKNIPTEIETQIFQGHIDFMLSQIKGVSEQ